jgi:hypothetical protein
MTVIAKAKAMPVRPLMADFCRMVLPEPAVRQIIGKSIETVGRAVKIGGVEMWRGDRRSGLSVAAPFV